MKHQLKHQLWSMTAPLGVGMVLLAACGGGSSTAPPSKLEATATTAPAAKTETKAETKPEATATTQAAPASAKASGEPIKIGQLCDRSGINVNVGTKFCDGFQNWVEVANNVLGGVKGRPVQAIEVDHKFEVPLAVDAYKKYVTRDNVPQILSFGTPMTDALAPSANQDKVVLWTPGYGLSESADGKKFPYVFVGVATYYSQAMAAMDYIAQEWKQQGKAGNAKVVYMYVDHPAGRDPLEVIKNESKGLGLDLLDTVGVPTTTLDMTSLMATIKEKNPDYIISHVSGRLPALSLQAAEKVGFPRENILSFVWGISEDEIEVARQAAEKYRGLQFAALWSDNPEAAQLMEKYWQDSGLQPNPKRHSVFYTRGVMAAAMMVEAMRLAEDPTKGESVKQGAERLKDFTAHGVISGTTITAEDHGGTRKVRMYQIENGQLERIKDWFEGPRATLEAGG